MPAFSKQPTITVIIPTLNSANVLEHCLRSIRYQKYNQNKISIYIIDGGSTDKTKKIAVSYNCQIFKNKLKTAEAGKAIGVKKSKSDFVALIDSDNILPDKDWLTDILSPFAKHPKLIGSEPWEYTYRSGGGFIERYSALTGVNDPYTLIAGNYDRLNLLSGTWTGLTLKTKDYQNYLLVNLPPHKLLPTIGANGTIFKTDFIKKYFHGSYLYDIDLISHAQNQSHRPLLFAKVKIGIIHTFCESSVQKFYRKQLRRATDLYIYNQDRQYPLTKNNFLPSMFFSLYVITIIPVLFDTIRGYIKKPDPAWFFHPLACLITLYTYSIQTLRHLFGILKPINRQQWSQ